MLSNPVVWYILICQELQDNTTTNILRPFFPLLWELAFCSPWQSPPFHSILCIISHQTSNFHVSLNHFLPMLFLVFPYPLLPSTVISILFFTQSFPSFLNTCPIHLSLLRLITSLIFSMPILSLSSAFVSPLSVTLHISISPFSFSAFLKFSFLLSIHCPCFTSIYHWTSNTCPIHFSLSTSMPPLTCQNTWQLPKLFSATSYSWSWCQTWSSFSIQHITQVAEFANSF